MTRKKRATAPKKPTPERARTASPAARAAWARTAARRTPCPSCKGFLVVRDGKHGKFMGCTNWPGCTYTRNMGGALGCDMYGDLGGDLEDYDYELDDFWNE